jgi:hypothetical protein
MSFWIREFAGWLLVGLGIFAFYWTFLFCSARMIFEAPILAVVGIFIFRGGIHLLKVAIAARIAKEAQQRLYPLPGPSNPTRKV